ncbi:MAG: hypothetical protein BGN88_14490 [Clostridiales bacterium 43-6]|nr:MAG: hypothetical protein BGN88_14490 [Clostridiales bacterium 43-6]
MNREKALPFLAGMNGYKLFWIFMVSSVIGYLVETVYCVLYTGQYESKQGLLYGPFSPIYGFGAVLLTLSMKLFIKRTDLFVLLFCGALGAGFEFVCSLFQESVFGTVSWEYSQSHLNLGGRTNLKYALIWGLFGVLYAKKIYPPLCKLIEKIPDDPGRLITRILLIFMLLNIIMSVVAVHRRGQRYQGVPASSYVDHVIDRYYNDDYMNKIYPNMKFVEKK